MQNIAEGREYIVLSEKYSMGNSPRCLFEDKIELFLSKEKEVTFGILCERYHGDALTTTREAWIKEIEILKRELQLWNDSEGHTINSVTSLGHRVLIDFRFRRTYYF